MKARPRRADVPVDVIRQGCETFQPGCSSDIPASNTYRCFRIPLLLWSFLSFMLVQWYLASLQSFLTSPSWVPVISTLRELNAFLNDHSAAKVCLHKEGFAQYVIEASEGNVSFRFVSFRVRVSPSLTPAICDHTRRLPLVFAEKQFAASQPAESCPSRGS